jgi:hypothetical protein
LGTPRIFFQPKSKSKLGNSFHRDLSINKLGKQPRMGNIDKPKKFGVHIIILYKV